MIQYKSFHILYMMICFASNFSYMTFQGNSGKKLPVNINISTSCGINSKTLEDSYISRPQLQTAGKFGPQLFEEVRAKVLEVIRELLMKTSIRLKMCCSFEPSYANLDIAILFVVCILKTEDLQRDNNRADEEGCLGNNVKNKILNLRSLTDMQKRLSIDMKSFIIENGLM
ncbi:hypothetical protein FF38_04580 [Lucilia cuprina]|uniref:Uncharacterized protein n=1 Tax=Lucilia cuprina TaxID=7375 RepID=A0A0L0BWB0_LUCCU|nr:hypothetical protein FF38_04580 [Lucilia cuprina]